MSHSNLTTAAVASLTVAVSSSKNQSSYADDDKRSERTRRDDHHDFNTGWVKGYDCVDPQQLHIIRDWSHLSGRRLRMNKMLLTYNAPVLVNPAATIIHDVIRHNGGAWRRFTPDNRAGRLIALHCLGKSIFTKEGDLLP